MNHKAAVRRWGSLLAGLVEPFVFGHNHVPSRAGIWRDFAFRSRHDLKNHVSPVRFWPSAQREFPKVFANRPAARTCNGTCEPFAYAAGPNTRFSVIGYVFNRLTGILPR